MAMTEEIAAIAAVFAQGCEQDMLTTLCRAAEEELIGRLRPGIGPEDCRESFLCAAALLAASYFAGSQGAGGVKHFSVGSVSVTTGGESRLAADLRTQAGLLMRPFCRNGFAFQGVQG